MNKAQWKAIYDFCEDYGCFFASDLLKILKSNGTLNFRDTFEDLARLPKNNTYEAMIDFLTENLN